MIKFMIDGIEFKIFPSEIIGLAMIALIFWAFWHAQTDKKNPIDLAGMFVWPGTRHTSMAMFLAFLASMIAFWIIIDQEFKKTLTTEMFSLFIATFVAGKGLTEGINAWRARGAPPPAQGAQYVASAGTVLQGTPVTPGTAAPPPTETAPITAPATAAAAAIVAAVKPKRHVRKKKAKK